jgi:hypothetical protein
MFIMAAPHVLKLDPVLSSKLIGEICLVLTACLLFVTARRLTLSSQSAKHSAQIVPALAFFAVCTSPALAIHAVSGMETSLYILLLTSFLAALVSETSSGTLIASPLTLGLLALLVGLARPEGNAAVALAMFTSYLLRRDGSSRRKLILSAVIYIFCGAMFFAWRYSYYGHVLPLPFYIKVGRSSYLSGLKHTASFVAYLSPLTVPLVAGISRYGRRCWPMAVGLGILLVFFCIPEHIMAPAWRFDAPLLPCAVLLAAVGMTSVGVLSSSRIRMLAMSILWISLLLPMGMAGLVELREARHYARGLNAAHVKLGKYLATTCGQRESCRLAIGDAGAVPYFSAWKTLDTFGLNDVHIAITGRHEPEYVFGQSPDVLVLQSRDTAHFRPILQYEQVLYEFALKRGMIFLGALEFDQTYYLWVFARAGGRWAPGIAYAPTARGESRAGESIRATGVWLSMRAVRELFRPRRSADDDREGVNS